MCLRVTAYVLCAFSALKLRFRSALKLLPWSSRLSPRSQNRGLGHPRAGDSITVAPGQTLTDREYQAMRNAAIAVMREIGVETVPLGPDKSTLLRVRLPLRPARSSFPENVHRLHFNPTPGGHDE